MKTKSNINLILTGLILSFICQIFLRNKALIINQNLLIMRKSFYLISILILGFIANTFGQDHLEFIFTAQNNGQHVSLDSIMIINTTQGGDTMLYAQDTVLELWIVGTNELNLPGANSFSVSQNYPNPFDGQTFIDVCIVKKDNIEIRVFDLSGREHVSYEGVLDAGKQTFGFYPGNENFYIFSASYCGLIRSIKIANPLSNKQDCKLTYKGLEKQAGNLKSHQDDNFPFSFGDQLIYIGYSNITAFIRGSDVIVEAPENSKTYTFDITEGIPCVDVPRLLYQGKYYYTVQIGAQCWLKENLNVGIRIDGIVIQTDNEVIEKYCYEDIEDNCDIYGGLYQWYETMQYVTTEGAQGICPLGWHIPTDEEWKQLEGEVDTFNGYPDPEWDNMDYRGLDVGERLKSQNTWDDNGGGNNFFGFSALATGARHWEGWFASLGIYTSNWSSTEGSPTGAYYRYMEYWSPQVARTYNNSEIGRSVRCVKDE